MRRKSDKIRQLDRFKSSSKKKKRKKETQPNFTNTDVPCLNTGYLFLVDRTSSSKLTQNLGLKLL